MNRKGCAIFILLPIIGLVIGLIVGSYVNSDQRIEWEYVGKAPEVPVGFKYTYRGFLLEGSSGHYYANCGIDCWTSDEIEEYLQYEIEDINCYERDPPEMHDLILEGSFCEPYGPGVIYTRIAVTSDLSIYVWERGLGEWNIIDTIFPPFAGAVGFFLIGVFINLLMWFNRYLVGLRQRALEEAD